MASERNQPERKGGDTHLLNQTKAETQARQVEIEREAFKSRPTNTIAETADFLRLGLNQTYAAAKAGEIPTIRIGNRILVPTARLLEMLGEAE